MLTGDKMETAVNIGFSTGILDSRQTTNMISLSRQTSHSGVYEKLKQYKELISNAIKNKKHVNNPEADLASYGESNEEEKKGIKNLPIGLQTFNSFLSFFIQTYEKSQIKTDVPLSQYKEHFLVVDGQSLNYVFEEEIAKTEMGILYFFKKFGNPITNAMKSLNSIKNGVKPEEKSKEQTAEEAEKAALPGLCFEEFAQLCGIVNGVIVCRATPLQKALIVRLMKKVRQIHFFCSFKKSLNSLSI